MKISSWLKPTPPRLRAWRRKQKAAAPGRYYGGTGTIHGNAALDVEVRDGTVVAVWFRCQSLPFVQSNATASRGEEMQRMYSEYQGPAIIGIEVLD